ncbi:MAG: BlaI/MecI/CopY family transcriptional regulator [bacterium]
MVRKTIDDLGELQKAVMESIWEQGEATVRQVRDKLKRRKPLAYTTILSIIQRLEKAGWVKHRVEGRTYVYQPTHSRNQEAGRSLKQFIARIFHGDTRVVLQHILDDEDLSSEELEELRELVNKKK